MKQIALNMSHKTADQRNDANRVMDVNRFGKMKNILGTAIICITGLAAAMPSFAAVPSINFETGTAITPSAADAWYAAQGTGHTNAATSAEVSELARALKYDPDLIYEFIRNNIEIEPTYGLGKGALGAIIDRNGTAFDQAHLMGELLKASGITASYKQGTITLSGAQVEAWLGISDASVLRTFLANGGIPHTVSGTTTITSATIGHVWVEATIDSVVRTWDPAYKDHTFHAGIDVGAAMGFDKTILRTVALTGAATGTELGASTIKSFNKSGVDTSLDTYASTLLTMLKTSHADKTLAEITGGQEITPEIIGATTGTDPLPYTTSVNATWTGGIPDAYRTKFKLSMQDGSPIVLTFERYMDSFYGRRLQIGNNPGLTKQSIHVWLDGVSQASYDTGVTFPGPWNFYQMSTHIEIDHPYAASSGAYMDRTVTKRPEMNAVNTVVYGLGYVSPHLGAKWSSESDNDIYWDQRPSELYFASSQQDRSKLRMAADWLSQFSQSLKLHGEMEGLKSQHHHTLGYVISQLFVDPLPDLECAPFTVCKNRSIGQKETRIDIDTAVSLVHETSSSTEREAGIYALSGYASLLESAVMEQVTDTADAVSSHIRFAWQNENEASFKFLHLTPANFATAKDLIAAGQTFDVWSPYSKTSITTAMQDYINDGYEIIAAQNITLGPGTTQCNCEQPDGRSIEQVPEPVPSYARGAAWFAFKPDATATAHIIQTPYGGSDEVYKGSGGDEEEDFNPLAVADILKDEFEDKTRELGVNLLTGELEYVPDADITTGSGGFPYSLSFQRTFKSGEGHSPNMPWGWTHNHDINAAMSASGMEALGGVGGASSPLNAVASLVALHAAHEVFTDTKSIDTILIPSFIMNWWQGKLTYNIVSITSGKGGQQFFRLVDGTFNPPKGTVGTLAQSGARQTIQSTLYENRRYEYDTIGFTYTDKSRSVQTFEYDHAVRYDAFQKTDPEDFNPFQKDVFRIKTWTFPQGPVVTYTYDASSSLQTQGLLTRIENNMGRSIDLTYATAGLGDGWVLEQVQGTGTGTAKFGYNNSRQLESVKRPIDAAPLKAYDYAFTSRRGGVWPKLTKVYKPSDAVLPVMEFVYDAVGRVKQVKDAQVLFDEANQIATPRAPYEFFIAGYGRGERVDPMGGQWSAYYDSQGRLIDQIDPLGRVSSATHDSFDRVVTRTGPEGQQAAFTYDARHNVTSVTKSPKTGGIEADIVASATYNSIDKIATLTDPLSNVYAFAYNTSTGTLTSATQPMVDTTGSGTPDTAPVWSFTYNAMGQELTRTDPELMVTAHTYHVTTYDRLTTRADSTGLNLTTTLTYNSVGDVLTATDPKGNTSSNIYDLLRRVTDVTAPLGTASKTNYDVDGLVTSEQVLLGASTWLTTSYTYTPTGQVETITDPEDNVTRTFYDALDRTDITIDAEFSKTQSVYNAAGQVLQVKRAIGTSLEQIYQTYTYDLSGHVTSVTDVRGNATAYTFDGHGRGLRTTFADTTFEEVTSYSVAGQVLERRNRSGDLIDYAYDDLGRELSQRISSGFDLVSFYDKAGRVTSHKRKDRSTSATSDIHSYTFDALGRLTQRDADGIWATKSVYDANSNRTKLIHADGFFVSYAYDELNRMAKVCQNETANYAVGPVTCSGTGTGTPLAAYSYDTLSRRTQTALGNGNEIDYSYFADSALQTLNHTFEAGQPSSADVSHTFGYNAVNQMVSKTITNGSFDWLPSAYATIAYGAASTLNQYPTIDAAALAYDDNGNMTSDGADFHAYNTYRNELTSVTKANGTIATFDYAPTGPRQAKIITNSPSGDYTVRFLMDGNEVIADFNGSDNTMIGSEVINRYVYGPGVDERIAMIDETGASPVTTWYHTNHQGSTIAMSDATGSVTETYTYDTFGNSDTLTGNPYRYTGRRLDAETGLYYYRARYYAPAIGRFLQIDPVGYADQMNLYSYVGNDPMNYKDPSGKYAYVIGTLPGSKSEPTPGCGLQVDCTHQFGVTSADVADGLDAAGNVIDVGQGLAVGLGEEALGAKIGLLGTVVDGASGLVEMRIEIQNGKSAGWALGDAVVEFAFTVGGGAIGTGLGATTCGAGPVCGVAVVAWSTAGSEIGGMYESDLQGQFHFMVDPFKPGSYIPSPTFDPRLDEPGLGDLDMWQRLFPRYYRDGHD